MALSVFLEAQKSSWYPLLLKPVADIITSDNYKKKVLDIGTGPGKLLEMLITQNSNLEVTGIDVDKRMIEVARRRLANYNISLHHQKANEKLEFEDNTFDDVVFCSVLFLLDDHTKRCLLNEALRVLKPDGKIIVLSPTGKKTVLSAFAEVWRYPLAATNWTFIFWKAFTTARARGWHRNQWLSAYSEKRSLCYSQTYVFNNNATLEIISHQT